MKNFILFDHDGVLVDTEKYYFEAGKCALAEIGFELDEAQYLDDMNESAGTWKQARAAGISETIIQQLILKRDALYQAFLQTEPIEIDGVVDALATLKQHVNMAIVTTSKAKDFQLIHKDRKIMDYMEFAIVREDYKTPKPHPAPYLMGLSKLGATAQETLVVEDSYRGLSSAIAAGIECAVVKNEFTKSHDLSAATYHIDRLADLLELIA